MMKDADSVKFKTNNVIPVRFKVIGYFEYNGDIIISAEEINFEAERSLFFLDSKKQMEMMLIGDINKPLITKEKTNDLALDHNKALLGLRIGLIGLDFDEKDKQKWKIPIKPLPSNLLFEYKKIVELIV